MHEYSVARALITRAEDVARSREAVRIRRVTVRIGELAGVDTGLLQTAYLLAREDTRCSDAPLEIVKVTAAWACRGCGAEIPAGGPLKCERCGGDATLRQGDELLLERIELEVR